MSDQEALVTVLVLTGMLLRRLRVTTPAALGVLFVVALLAIAELRRA
jgi:hypothetical protein